MKIQCQCGAVYNVPESAAGKKVNCQRCSTTFICPAPPAPAVGTAKQNVPPAFASSPDAQKKRANHPDSTRRAQENAILKQHMSKKSIEKERRLEHRGKAIERDRSANSIVSMICGAAAMAAAISLGVVLWSLTDAPMDVPIPRRRSWTISFLLLTGGKYWLPLLVFLVGLYFFVVGILSHKRVINLEPHHYLHTLWDFVSHLRWWW